MWAPWLRAYLDIYAAGPATDFSPPGQAERPDAGRVGRCALLYMIADVPDRAIVGGIHRGLRVILPPHQLLRRFAFRQHRFAKRQQAERIVGKPCGNTLTWIGRRASERVADRNVAPPIDRRARHP